MARQPDRGRGSQQPPPPEASPLWGLVLVLGEIAECVERRRVQELTAESPQTRRATGTDSAAQEGTS